MAVGGAEHVDWEDIAIRGRTLYVGDIGDNLAQRPDIAVYRFAEPAPGATARATRIVLRYPDGPHDAEALLVDPRNGTLVIVTKDFGGRSGVYIAAEAAPAQAATLGSASARRSRPATSPPTAARSSCAATTARSSGPSARSESIATALQARALHRRPPNLFDEGQGEALALTRNGRAFYTVPEGASPALRRYG